MGRTVGIDLGTTYSLIAYLDQAAGKPGVHSWAAGRYAVPSL